MPNERVSDEPALDRSLSRAFLTSISKKRAHLDMTSQNVSTEKGALSWYDLPAKCRTGESGGAPQ